MAESGSVFELAFNVDTRSLGKGLSRLNKGLNQAQRSASVLGNSLNRAFAVFASTAALKTLILTGDAFLSIQNRLRTVVQGTLALEVTQAQLLDIANRTRTSFETNVEVFQRLTAATQALKLGLGREGVLGVMETLNQAISLSGATSIEATQALRQLTQGLASGALKGDELRSVLEQLPTIADIIARQLGVTRGQLKELGERSKITSQVIVDAFRNARTEIAEKFAKSVPTVGQAFTLLRNSFVKLVGDIENSTGVFTKLAEAIKLVADNLPDIASALFGIATILGARVLGKALTAATVAWKEYRAAAIAATTVETLGAFSNGVSRLVSVTVEGAASWAGFARTIINSKGGILAAFALFGFAVHKLFDSLQKESEFTRAELDELSLSAVELSSIGSRIVSLNKELRSLEGRQVISQSAIDRIAQIKMELDKAADAARDARKGISMVGRAEIDSLLAKLAKEHQLLKLSNDEREIQERVEKEIESLRKKKIVLIDEEEKALRARLTTALQSNAIEERTAKLVDDIVAPQREYQQTLEAINIALAQNRINEEQAAAARQKAKDSFRSSAPEIKDTAAKLVQEQLVAMQNQVRIQSLLVQGRKEEAAALEIALELKEKVGALSKDQLAALAVQQRELEMLELANKLVEDSINPAVTYRKEVEAINIAQAKLGLSAQQAAIAVRAAYLRMLEAQLTFEAGVKRAFLKLQIEATNFAAVGEKIVNAFADNMTEALVQFAETGKFKFKEFARSLVSDLTRIIARLLVVQALTAAFAGGAPPNLLPAGGAGAPFPFPDGRASGGPVRRGQSYMVGEEGPELFQPRESGNIVPNGGGAKPQVNVQSITVLNPDMIPQAMASGKVDESIVTVIGRNTERISRLLSR